MNGLKRLLKRALADRLPPEIVEAREAGFGVPFGSWFRGPMAGLVRDVLARERLRRAGLFDPDVVERLVGEHIAGTRDHDGALWTLLVFEFWRSEYLGADVMRYAT